MRKLVVVILYIIVTQVNFAQETNVERLTKAETELKEALAKEDYEKAAALKKEIQLRQEIEVAVKNGDYDKAAQLKGELTGTTAPQSIKNTQDFNAESHAIKAKMAGFTPPAPGKALVEILRVTHMSWGHEFFVFCDNQLVGSVQGVSHIRLELEPGEHVIWISEVGNEFVKISVEADKTYFIYHDNVIGKMDQNSDLSPVKPDEHERIVRGLEVIANHPPRTMSGAELAKNQEKLFKKKNVRKVYDPETKQFTVDMKRTDIMTVDMSIPESYFK